MIEINKTKCEVYSEPDLFYPFYNSDDTFNIFKSPCVSLIGKTDILVNQICHYLDSRNIEDAGTDYFIDMHASKNNEESSSGDLLAKLSGQICYQSFGENRTKNNEMKKYFDNILSSGHGSVLEHSNFSFLIWGVSRSLTHELVRHRHFSFSQTSQRYVKNIAFVYRPEYFYEPLLSELEETKKNAIDIYKKYHEFINDFKSIQTEEGRKNLNQIARSILPNFTETSLVITANVRALRNFMSLRCSRHADTEIRLLAYYILQILQQNTILFDDFEINQFGDKHYEVEAISQYGKV